MNRPVILVVGAGSIGRRHVRNLLDLGADVVVTDIDSSAARSTGTSARVVSFEAWPETQAHGIVVATPTVHHADQLGTALDVCDHVLIEKPLVTHPAELAVVEGREDSIMVGFNLRLHAPIERLWEIVHNDDIGSVLAGRLWFGSYLPDWRPSVDYRGTYSAQRHLGGGVLLDAIHEIDLARWFFGPLQVHSSLVATVGGLPIDVEDTVRATLLTGDGAPVEVALDYLSRRYRRGIEIIGETGTATFDWAHAAVTVETATEQRREPYDDHVDASYVREAAAFLEWIEGRRVPPVDGRAGANSVRLAHEIRVASA